MFPFKRKKRTLDTAPKDEAQGADIGDTLQDLPSTAEEDTYDEPAESAARDSETNSDTDTDNEAETVTSGESVTLLPGSVLQLAEFANSRGSGNMQFMSKKTHEVFELRESHFRLARVWGSVTVARECSPEEYALIALAMDIIENEDDYYMLPGLTDTELDRAIEQFCEDKFSISGKKYSKAPERFLKLLKENDRLDEWKEHTFSLLCTKLERFCEENGIVLEGDTRPEIHEPITDESAPDGDAL